ncbi:MAG: ferritin-like domain-containing protein [Armatimonadota bacterium]
MQHSAESLSSLVSNPSELSDINPDTRPEEIVERVQDKAADKRAARRDFLKTAGIAGASLAAVGLLSKNANAQRGSLDPAVLTFALNLEYLEAEYYLRATTGNSLSAADAGAGAGAVTGGSLVPFGTDTDVQAYAVEITNDEVAHVRFLRSALTAAGVTPVPRPAIDLLNSFSAAGAALSTPVPGFNPFASSLAFLIGAFVFEDVGVTAYKGGATLLTNKNYLEAAAGILGVEAYHAGSIRTVLYARRATAVTASANVGQVVQAISDLRDAVDNQDGSGTAGDDRDQGIVTDPNTGGAANLVPTDANSIAYTRNTSSVLRIVYLAGPIGTAPGTTIVSPLGGNGFFPQGLNGIIR